MQSLNPNKQTNQRNTWKYASDAKIRQNIRILVWFPEKSGEWKGSGRAREEVSKEIFFFKKKKKKIYKKMEMQ